MIIDLLCQTHAHLFDVSFRVIFVGLRHEEHDLREHECNIISDNLHVLRVSLIAMNQDPKMNTILIILGRCLL